MKTWKRILALLLALAMVFALAACGGRSSDDEDDEDERPSARRQNRERGRGESTGNEGFGGFSLPGTGEQTGEKPAEAVPAEVPAEAVPAEVPAEAVPAEVPAETVPAEVPAEAVPAEAEPAPTALRVALVAAGRMADDVIAADILESLEPLADAGKIELTVYENDGFAEDLDLLEPISRGAEVVVVGNWLFGEAIGRMAQDYPEVCFLCLDMNVYDLYLDDDSKIPANVQFVLFREEQAGFLAGYAAVKMGFRELGFLGGMNVPAVVRYGYGFVQGADMAADELGLSDVIINFAYANQFFGDVVITDAMESWYAAGTEVIFACGGGIYTSVGEAAAVYGGRVIGIDYDQKATIDGLYGEGVTLSSAVKNVGLAAAMVIEQLLTGALDGTGGSMTYTLGIYDAGPNCYVGLARSTAFTGEFTEREYEKLLELIAYGYYNVSDDTWGDPGDLVSTVDVRNYGMLK